MCVAVCVSTVSKHANKQVYSTYMAAAGLTPSYSTSSGGGGHAPPAQRERLNLICMVQFASSLMQSLNNINKQSFQVFKLRVGLNSGSVIAGVIGAQRPFYDIWGDCVNIASRMESLGEINRIQVEESCARLLAEGLCTDSEYA